MTRSEKTVFFAAANTESGFLSYFDSIFSPEELSHIYILKGGPGTGKSTLIEKVGRAAEKRGLEAVYYACSSDTDSLDGVVIPTISTAVIDGTAPHLTDPCYPGAVERILNLGSAFDGKLLSEKDRIMPLIRDKREMMKRAYRYLFAAGAGFLESEVLRTKGIELDLSEMFVVSHTMMDRATYYIRQYGEGCSYAPGGSTYDVLYCMANYGLCPQEAMPGILYGDTLPNHNEVDAVTSAFLKALVSSNLKKLTPVWKNAFQAIWDSYVGACPETFVYGGKTYTPQSFVEYLGLNEDDYVNLTSYTHHPFYKKFAMEVPDNWRMNQAYNLPLDELMQVIDNALEKGYTLAWGADVSEMGFTRKGIGVMPDADHGADLTGSDMAHWLGMSADDKRTELTKRPLPEVEVTQAMRQEALDNWETTDDHGMQIFGLATDQNGKEYYMIKNSWGTQKSEYQGIWYISRAFMAYKTNEILVHKDALPKDIKKKLGIK